MAGRGNVRAKHSAFRANWIGLSAVLLILGLGAIAAAGATAPRTSVSPAVLSIGAWSNLTKSAGTNPGGRADAGFTWDPQLGRALLFGGFKDTCPTGCAVPLNSTWTYNGTWKNITARVANAPPTRWAIEHSLTYDVADHYALLFGGSDGAGNVLGDTWAYAHYAWKNLTGKVGTAPPARYFTSLTYDAAAHGVLLFGGASGPRGTYYNDTWIYSGGKWTQLTLSTAPSPRRAANLAYDSACRCVVLEGGVTSGGSGLSDSWTFRAGAWHPVSVKTLPPARWISSMAYDPARSALVLYGGCTALGCVTDVNDTWYFGSGHWTNVTSHLAVTPLAIGGSMGAYDPWSKELVVYGGLPPPGYQYINQTWGYS
ncbi:MAG: kelch repeat-containing protein [Candidatus Lutacidiplasmatales archaeon]